MTKVNSGTQDTSHFNQLVQGPLAVGLKEVESFVYAWGHAMINCTNDFSINI